MLTKIDRCEDIANKPLHPLMSEITALAFMQLMQKAKL